MTELEQLRAFVEELADGWEREGMRGDNPGWSKAAHELLEKLKVDAAEAAQPPLTVEGKVRAVPPRFAIVGFRPLLDAVRQLATLWEPWSDKVYCNVEDYVEASLRGEETRVPIPNEAIGSAAMFGHFTHPLSPERFEEDARTMREQTHVVALLPDRYIPRGQIAAG